MSGVDHAGALKWLDAQCDDENANERFREVRHYIGALRAQLEAAEAEVAHRTAHIIVHDGQGLACSDWVRQAYEAIKARAEADEADAKRFVWWFGRGLESSDELVALHMQAINGNYPSVDAWRSAIDAARTKEDAA